MATAYNIRQEIESARPDSVYEGQRDLCGVLEIIAYFRHISEVRVNRRETLSWEQNNEFAKLAFHAWAVNDNRKWPFESLGARVHSFLKSEAYRRYDLHSGWEECEKPSAEFWEEAKLELANKVMDYHSQPSGQAA